MTNELPPPSGIEICRNSTGSDCPAGQTSDSTPDPKPTRNTPDKIGIHRRIDTKRFHHCWRVQIVRNGQVYEKKFSDSRYGGEEATLKVAQAWRDDIVARYASMSLAEFCAILRSNNTSGMTGVNRHAGVRIDKNGCVFEFALWQASISLDSGKTRTRSFSIPKYGEEKAKALAMEARSYALKAHENVEFRACIQPLSVSTEEDIRLVHEMIEADQNLIEVRRQKELATRKARAQRIAQRDAIRLAELEALERKALQTTNSSGEPYIGRYSAATKGAGWKVSIVRDGKRYGKHFRDSAWGGTLPALDAAKIWRDDIFYSLPMITKAQLVSRKRSDSKSGIPGVSRKVHKVNGKEYWCARSPEISGHPTRIKLFSIEKYGEQRALEMAVKARETFMAGLSAVPHVFRHAAKQMLHRKGLPVSTAD